MLRVASIPRTMSATIVVALTAMAGTNVVSRDPALDVGLPEASHDGAGAWDAADRLIATGHAPGITIYDAAKNKRLMLEAAEADARRRIACHAAAAADPTFDPDCFDLHARLDGFRTAATFSREGEGGLFMIGVCDRNAVHVKPQFNVALARAKARALFDAGDFTTSARRFADLTARGVQDSQTIAWAHAAAWQVNLASGVSGPAKAEALQGLGDFYLRRGDREAALQKLHALYADEPQPDRPLLDRLIILCEQTGRSTTAAGLRRETARRWPATRTASDRPAARDAKLAPPYEGVFARTADLLCDGGAGVVRLDDVDYFVAVGVTAAPTDTPADRLLQKKVAKAKALAEAAKFVGGNVVTAETTVRHTMIRRSDARSTAGSQSASVDEAIVARVSDVLQRLDDVGTWKSADGKELYFAVGCRLPQQNSNYLKKD